MTRERFERLLWIILILGVLWGIRPADAAYIPLPSGLIGHFNATTCPNGWTEFTAGRGFYIVNRVASGTLNTPVGSALTDQENRAHTHSIPQLVLGNSSSGVWSAGDLGMNSGGGGFGWWDGATYWDSAVSSTTKATNPAATHTGTTGNPSTTIAPYIQLLACQKS